MNAADRTIEHAMSLVAQSRSLRERALERRRELQRRAEMVTAKPVYILKKKGGRQLSLRLDSWPIVGDWMIGSLQVGWCRRFDIALAANKNPAQACDRTGFLKTVSCIGLLHTLKGWLRGSNCCFCRAGQSVRLAQNHDWLLCWFRRRRDACGLKFTIHRYGCVDLFMSDAIGKCRRGRKADHGCDYENCLHVILPSFVLVKYCDFAAVF